MKIHEVLEQGTPEWLELRRGKFTASIASKLLTPGGKISTQYKSEIGRIIAEKLKLQPPESNFESYWMERGTLLEEEARRWFEVEQGVDINQVGFIESDSGHVGASPDGLIYHTVRVNDDLDDFYRIPLELKVPKPSTHIKWLLNDELPSEHKGQLHFQMAMLGAPYGYFMSYNPEVGPLIVKVEADAYTTAMVEAIKVYEADLLWSLQEIEGVEE